MGLFDSINIFGRRSSAGKIAGRPTDRKGRGVGILSVFNRDKLTEIDYTENNYDLFRAIYYNSTVNGTGGDYGIAAALGKPIVNIAASYTVGRGFDIQFDNPDNDPLITEAEEQLNVWLKDNQRIIYNLVKHSYRDGDSYVHIDEFGELTEVDATGVTEIVDPVSNKTVGFDVMRKVEMFDSASLGSNSSTTYIYVKQYRMDSIRIYRYQDGHANNPEIIWEKVFTKDGAVDLPRDNEGNSLGVDTGSIQERKLAICAFHNEPEAESVYGNSDYQNLLSVLANYSELIKSATKGSKYNAVPIPVIMGLDSPRQAQQQNEYRTGDGKMISAAAASLDSETAAVYAQSENNEEAGIKWGADKVLYISKGGDAKFISGNGFMGDLGKLLEYYFYLLVQGSETPEYVLGTAVSSSKASTETQGPVFDKKIERKQLELAEFIKDMVNTVIERRALMSDPLYINLRNIAPRIMVNFPPLDNDDMKVTFDTVQWAYENGLLTGERVLLLLLSDKIKDVPSEIRNAAEEAKKRVEENPASSDRYIRELFAKPQETQEQEQEDKE